MNDNDLFDADGIFTQTEHYILRRILPEDQPFYQQLAQAETPAFLQNTSLAGASSPAWEELLAEDHLTCSILQRDTHIFCGFCQLQWIFSPTPELGVDLLHQYQKRGIAIEVLPAFLARAKKLLPLEYVSAKIRKNNLPSQRLAEKLGGVCIGEKSLLPPSFPRELATMAEREFPQLFYLEYHFYEKEK